jgi:hypothetical protein
VEFLFDDGFDHTLYFPLFLFSLPPSREEDRGEYGADAHYGADDGAGNPGGV